jgi:hypothetical protein
VRTGGGGGRLPQPSTTDSLSRSPVPLGPTFKGMSEDERTEPMQALRARGKWGLRHCDKFFSLMLVWKRRVEQERTQACPRDLVRPLRPLPVASGAVKQAKFKLIPTLTCTTPTNVYVQQILLHSWQPRPAEGPSGRSSGGKEVRSRRQNAATRLVSRCATAPECRPTAVQTSIFLPVSPVRMQLGLTSATLFRVLLLFPLAHRSFLFAFPQCPRRRRRTLCL